MTIFNNRGQNNIYAVGKRTWDFNKKHAYEDEQAVMNMLASTDLGYLTLKRQQGGQNIILVDGTGYNKTTSGNKHEITDL